MFCLGCGREVGECDGACRRPLDPPRFCPTCGKRLFVQVTPNGYEAHCRAHGVPSRPSDSTRDRGRDAGAVNDP
ncbi:MAG: hypothetical protein M3343_12360 [Actinomycetota bacterium]|nr:hypothetical protein [Actinomycetota bacterium]